MLTLMYLFLQNKFRKWHIRDGEQTKGRIGFSLASLGDTDKDGFGDFAVGAPYSGPRGEGVVFIFRGSKGGVRERAEQVRGGQINTGKHTASPDIVHRDAVFPLRG